MYKEDNLIRINFLSKGIDKIEKLKILYLEVDRANRLILEKKFEEHKPYWEVDSYNLVPNSELISSYDAIIMNFRLPDDGSLKILQNIREFYSKPIIALTTGALIGDREKCLNGGCDAYFPMPYDYKSLKLEETILELVTKYNKDQKKSLEILNQNSYF